MSKLRVACYAISTDGYGAGPAQSLENPLGVGGTGLHQWFFPTQVFQETVLGKSGGKTGLDNDFARLGMDNLGAWILGRNMFAPSRGPWTDDGWKGWWGPNPPYHTPVFVLTHHKRPPLEMEGGTVFHFVEGHREALRLARAAAGNKDVRVGGGAATIRQYLMDGLIDEMHLVISPVLLGSGEALLQGIDLLKLGYRVNEHATSPAASHIVITK